MSRSCSVCSRSDAGAINELLGEGRSARSLAAELVLSHAAMLRHARNHVAKVAPAAVPKSAGDPLDELVESLRTRALAGNPAIVHQYRLALAAQSDARHATPPRHDLASESEWTELRTRMLAALAAFPEARAAVVAAIGGL